MITLKCANNKIGEVKLKHKALQHVKADPVFKSYAHNFHSCYAVYT